MYHAKVNNARLYIIQLILLFNPYPLLISYAKGGDYFGYRRINYSYTDNNLAGGIFSKLRGRIDSCTSGNCGSYFYLQNADAPRLKFNLQYFGKFFKILHYKFFKRRKSYTRCRMKRNHIFTSVSFNKLAVS